MIMYDTANRTFIERKIPMNSVHVCLFYSILHDTLARQMLADLFLRKLQPSCEITPEESIIC